MDSNCEFQAQQGQAHADGRQNDVVYGGRFHRAYRPRHNVLLSSINQILTNKLSHAAIPRCRRHMVRRFSQFAAPQEFSLLSRLPPARSGLALSVDGVCERQTVPERIVHRHVLTAPGRFYDLGSGISILLRYTLPLQRSQIIRFNPQRRAGLPSPWCSDR
jgi:hypothetical protein